MFSRQHYKLIASIIQEQIGEENNGYQDNKGLMDKTGLHAYEHAIAGMEMVAVRLAQEFKRDNPRFDYDKFMKACGIPI